MKTETFSDEHCSLCGSKHCQCRLGRHDKYGHSLNRSACTPREADAQGEQRRLDRAELDARTDNDEL